MSTRLLEIAEAPAAHITPSHPRTVFGNGYVLSQMGHKEGAVQAIRLADEDVETAHAEVLRVAREREFHNVGWWVSELSTPRDIGPRLGLEHRETLDALVLTEPPATTSTLTVRRVETLEDFATAQNIDGAEHGWEPGTPEHHAESWERLKDFFLLWLALDGDRPVGMARAAAADGALMLIGGATLSAERGRGVYRSLVEARWHAAVERGTPALVVAANGQSGPILRGLGFASVGAIEVWDDRL